MWVVRYSVGRCLPLSQNLVISILRAKVNPLTFTSKKKRMLLLLILISLASTHAQLLSFYKAHRDAPNQAMLLASCALSADRTTLNGMVCNADRASLVVGCLNTHSALGCDTASGHWLAV